MRRVIYDYQIFCQQKYGGISRYFYDLATRMAKYESFEVKILTGLHVNGYLQEIEPGLVTGISIPRVPKAGRALRYFDQSFSKVWLKVHPPDIVHETFYSVSGVAPKGTATVLTVYDFMDEIFTPENEIIPVKAAAIQRADHLICISESTRNDLLDRLHVDSSKVSVVYPAVGLADLLLLKTQTETNLPKIELAKPYILFVGNRSGYKNFNGLMRAFASSKSLVKDFNIVAFGSVPLQNQELELAQSLGIPAESLTWTCGDDSRLEQFYRGAAALVFPSLYEGFGNPPLEALAAKCPVICSNTSSMPEVSGDAAQYFNPYDIENMTIAMETVLYSQSKKEEMILRGQERAKLFSLDKFAAQVRDVYLSLA